MAPTRPTAQPHPRNLYSWQRTVDANVVEPPSLDGIRDHIHCRSTSGDRLTRRHPPLPPAQSRRFSDFVGWTIRRNGPSMAKGWPKTKNFTP